MRSDPRMKRSEAFGSVQKRPIVGRFRPNAKRLVAFGSSSPPIGGEEPTTLHGMTIPDTTG